MDAFRKTLLAVAAHIRSLGYRVFVEKDDDASWGYYSDGRSVAYFQTVSWAPGIQTAIVNRTPGSNGRHFLLQREGATVPLSEIDKTLLEKAFQDYPDYFDAEDRERMYCIKHADLEDFLNRYPKEELIEI